MSAYEDEGAIVCVCVLFKSHVFDSILWTPHKTDLQGALWCCSHCSPTLTERTRNAKLCGGRRGGGVRAGLCVVYLSFFLSRPSSVSLPSDIFFRPQKQTAGGVSLFSAVCRFLLMFMPFVSVVSALWCQNIVQLPPSACRWHHCTLANWWKNVTTNHLRGDFPAEWKPSGRCTHTHTHTHTSPPSV